MIQRLSDDIESRIVRLITKNDRISIDMMAQTLDMSKITVSGEIHGLKKRGPSQGSADQ